ncbi:MAG: peptide MFS transporter [Bryobacteraceae bacterium]
MSPPSSQARDTRDASFFGHPRGLATLFFTEMWERFSFYGMRALLILFMTASLEKGGLGFDVSKAGAIYGLYTASVYLLGLPGGWVADQILGQRRAVLYGGIIIALGHFSMAMQSVSAFFGGLILIVLGTGLLKPNISAIVGKLYPANDNRRDAGFSIFYMGINLGAFSAPLICGYVGQRINWHWGFGLAGIGMTAGLVQYVLGARHLGEAGARPAGDVRKATKLFVTALSVVAACIAAVVALSASGMIAVTAQGVAKAAGIGLTVIVIAVFTALFSASGWTPVERRRLIAIAGLFVASALFWSLYEQAGSTLNLFAERSTDKHIFGYEYPASWLQSVPGLMVIALAPVFAWIWIRLGPRDPSSPTKFALGLVQVGLGFLVMTIAAVRAASGEQVSDGYLWLTYLLHTTGELCLSPVGLSAFSKLAPPKLTGMMMGVFFMSLSVGNYIGGNIASVYETFPLPVLFGIVGGSGVGFGLLLGLLVKPIKKLMGDVN